MYEWCVYTRLPRCYMKSKLWYDGLSYHFIEPPIIEIRMNSSYETFAAHRQTEEVNWRVNVIRLIDIIMTSSNITEAFDRPLQ